MGVYDKEGTKYYGYQNNNYVSPTLIQNVISDPDFEREGAWTAARFSNEEGTVRPTIVPSYGWFDENGFNKAIDNISSIEGKNLSNYLELNFESTGAAVINFGPRDYRTTIKHIEPDEEWILAVKYSDTKGNPIIWHIQ